MKTKTLLIIGAVILLGVFAFKKEWLVTGTGDKFAQCFNAQYSNEDIYVTMAYKSIVPSTSLKVDLKAGDAPGSLDGAALQTKYVSGSTMVDYYGITTPITTYEAYLVKMGTFNNLAIGTRYCLVFSSTEGGFMGYIPISHNSGYANSWAQSCYPSCGSWTQRVEAPDAYMKQVVVSGSCIPMGNVLTAITEWKARARTMDSLLQLTAQYWTSPC